MRPRPAAAIALVLLAAACYSPKFTEGLLCSPDMDCPEGQTCIDNVCLVSARDGGGGSDGACSPAEHEASPLGRLTAADAADGDQLGGAIAMDGTWIAIGADLDDDRGDDAGAVYMFERQAAGWVEVQKLTASDGDMQDGFGTAVALHGSVLVVGAPPTCSRWTPAPGPSRPV
jgi:hypothetical protein